MIVLRTFKFRLYPTLAQERQMFNTLNVCRSWYNMCLDERKLAWENGKIKVTKSEQEKTGIRYKRTFKKANGVFSQTLQTVVDDLDKAFQAFFRRVKTGEKAGYPRFKTQNNFHSFAFKQFGSGAKFDGRYLKLYGIGRVAVRWHRSIEGTIKTVRIIHKAGKWFACFACEIEPSVPFPRTGQTIGIDLGVSTLITTSEGEKVDHPQFYRKGQKKLRLLQRKLTRAKHGSRNRRKVLKQIQRQQEHIANQRSDYLHKLSATLVRIYDAIAVEDLYIKNMMCNHHLNKSILDSGWSIFKQYLAYKAESAGREICLVNPAYTSKCCSSCGQIFKDFNLSTRWVECDCGLSLDRDHNAAINILNRAGWDTSVERNVATLPLSQGEGRGKRVQKTAPF